MTERELTLQDYMAMLRRRWVLIVILAVVGAPLAYVVSRFLPDRYKSQTLVLVEQPSIPSDIVRSLDTADITQRLSSMRSKSSVARDSSRSSRNSGCTRVRSTRCRWRTSSADCKRESK